MNLPDSVADVALSPDGGMLAMAAGVTLVVSSASGAGPGRALEHPAAIEAIAFAPRGDRIAVACEDATVHVHDLDSGAAGRTVTGETGGFASVAWSPDGALLAAGHHEPWVSVFDTASLALVAMLDPETFDDEGRTAVAFAGPDRLLSTARDRLVLWTLPARRPPWKRVSRRTLNAAADVHLVDAVPSHDASLVAAIAEDEGRCALLVWPLHGRRRARRSDLPGYARRVIWLDGDTVLAVSLWDRAEIALVDAATLALQGAWPTPGGQPGPLALWPDGERVVVGLDTGTVLTIRTDTGRAEPFAGRTP